MGTTRIIYPDTIPGYAELPIHEYEDGHKACKFCGQEPLWNSYEEYVEHWYEKEFEGTVVESDGYVWTPQPQSEEKFNYFESTCLGNHPLS